MMESDIDDTVRSLIKDSKKDLQWELNLDCFILRIISIPHSTLIWVVGGEEHVFLVDAKKARIVKKYEHVGEIIFSSVLHPKTSDLILSSSNGVSMLTIGGEHVWLLKEDRWFEHLAISTTGEFLLVSKGKTLCIFQEDEQRYQLINQDSTFKSTISDLIFHIDAFLISNYGGVREYDVSDLKNYKVFEWKTSLLNISWSPNKQYIAAGTQENAIHFWPYPLQKGQDFQMGGYPTKAHLILWSEDSTKFIVNGLEELHCWDFSQGPPTGKSPRTFVCGFGKITEILYNESLLVAASEQGVICYFKPSQSDQVGQIHAVDDQISCVSFADDESALYVGSKSGVVYCF